MCSQRRKYEQLVDNFEIMLTLTTAFLMVCTIYRANNFVKHWFLAVKDFLRSEPTVFLLKLKWGKSYLIKVITRRVKQNRTLIYNDVIYNHEGIHTRTTHKHWRTSKIVYFVSEYFLGGERERPIDIFYSISETKYLPCGNTGRMFVYLI